MSVSSTAYTPFLRARMSVPTMSVMFVRFRRYDGRCDQLRPLVLAGRPLRGATQRSLSGRRRGPNWLLRSADIARGRGWFPNIRGWSVPRQLAAVSTTLLVMAWSILNSRSAATVTSFSSSSGGRWSRTVTRTFWSSTKRIKCTAKQVKIFRLEYKLCCMLVNTSDVVAAHPVHRLHSYYSLLQTWFYHSIVLVRWCRPPMIILRI